MTQMDFELAAKRGVGYKGAVGFMPYKEVDKKIVLDYQKIRENLASDAAMSTAPNIGAPIQLYTYLNPQVIETLFAVTNATKVFDRKKACDWEDEQAQFIVEEIAGSVSPYSDYSDGTQTDVNNTWPIRQNFRYQTTIKYGDLELAKAAKAKIDLAARKQLAASKIIARAENAFQIYGVAGMEIYGMLNDPNIPTAISPISVNSKSTWADKIAADPDGAANLVYNDVNKLWAELTTNNGGHLDVNAHIILCISNKMVSYLTQPNSYGKTAKVLLQENYPNIEFVQMPELTTDSGEMLYMVVKDLVNEEVGFAGFSQAFMLNQLVRGLSDYKQKAHAGTTGCVITRPSAVAVMTGI